MASVAGSPLGPRSGHLILNSRLSRIHRTRETSMSDLKILGVCGSLRKSSLNMAALRACNDLMPSGMSMKIAQIGDLPMYHQDVFDAGIGGAVKLAGAGRRAADAVLIASPEYNFSLPPV